jgi:ankyrin repeat protein
MAESDRAWPSHCVYIVDEYCARHGLALPEADFDPDDPADIHSLLNVPDNPLEDEYVLRDGLSEAARADDLSTARALLEDGIHPHAAGSAGYTPLGAAAAAGHYGMVELLLGAGAAADDVGADDESGDEDEDEEPDLYDGLGEDAALHLAAENGHLDVCRLLLDHGASADADGMNRIKPLHGAAQNGHLDVCTLLLARKATPDARDKDDATPLHLAAGNGHVDICALLLKRGARVNVVSRRSQSRPIWVAHLDEWSGETRTYQDGWESPVRENRTPLHYAVAGGHEEIVKLLVERGADASIEDGWGESATDIALDDVHRGRGSEEILDILTAGQR